MSIRKEVFANGRKVSQRTLDSCQSMEKDIEWLVNRGAEISVFDGCIGFVNEDLDTMVWNYVEV